MVNDVTSIGAKVEGELELREAMLKFRGPDGDSEGREERGVPCWLMVSTSVERDELLGKEFRNPFWIA